MVQNGPNDHFGRNDLIPNRILAFARPKWTKMVHFGPFWPKEVHFGPFRSANRTLATPEPRVQAEAKVPELLDAMQSQPLGTASNRHKPAPKGEAIN